MGGDAEHTLHCTCLHRPHMGATGPVRNVGKVNIEVALGVEVHAACWPAAHAIGIEADRLGRLDQMPCFIMPWWCKSSKDLALQRNTLGSRSIACCIISTGMLSPYTSSFTSSPA